MELSEQVANVLADPASLVVVEDDGATVVLRAQDVKVDDLVYMGSVHSWKRITSRVEHGLQVEWTFSGSGWAKRGFSEKVQVLKQQPCEECRGAGEISRQHPDWGSRNCPSPTVEETCGSCGGSGRRY